MWVRIPPRALFMKRITDLFVVWIIVAAGAAFAWPAGFAWFQPYIVPALGVVMFGMGITLTPADFKRVVERPYAVLVGTVAQFAIMPLTGAALAKAFGVSPAIAAGLILVGACPGGQRRMSSRILQRLTSRLRSR